MADPILVPLGVAEGWVYKVCAGAAAMLAALWLYASSREKEQRQQLTKLRDQYQAEALAREEAHRAELRELGHEHREDLEKCWTVVRRVEQASRDLAKQLNSTPGGAA